MRMRKATLFIAVSVDGYIADRQGGVAWLRGHSESEPDVDGYGAFIREVDTVVMGYTTYRQIVTELSPEAWPYDGLTTYVLTHRGAERDEQVVFTAEEPAALLRRLKAEPGKEIWICGGAQVVQQLVRADAIDCYHLTMIPTLLGEGVRLFAHGEREIPLALMRTQMGNGMLEAVYERR